MRPITKWLLLLAALSVAATAPAASPKLVCKLTGKKVDPCCCEVQKNGKWLCKLTGKELDKCCCKGM